MKAYIAYDMNRDAGVSIVVFAENAGKAKAYAASHEDFDIYSFTEMRVRRCKELDSYWNGRNEMDWLNMDDRIAMVKYAGFQCSYEVDHPECGGCEAYEWCDRGKGAEE